MKEEIIHIRYHIYKVEELFELDRELVKKARTAAKSAYAPYSSFHVGAAVRLINDNIIFGNNQENSSYPLGLCAERVALFSAGASYPDTAVEAIAICGFYKNAYTDVCPPCGACRQVLLETEQRFNHNIKIILPGIDAVLVFDTIKDLLPLQFSADNLA